jgi:acyl-CoA synthetase (NDP forming)
VNTDPDVRLNASLAPLPPLSGRAGFFCQSGALGVAVLGEAARRGLGVSTFVSAGNRADVSGNDLLQYWETDDATDVVLLYLESFGNPRKFARLTRRLGRTKPIVAVKSGAGSVVAGLESTTVELPETSVRALFEASGVIRVDTLGDLFDVALLLTSQPLPTGERVAVVGNSTALGVLVSNASAAQGLQLVRIEDVGVDASPEAFRAALAAAVDASDVDAVVVVFVPPLQQTSGEDFAAALRSVAVTSHKPVLSTFLGFEGVPTPLAGEGVSSPARGSVPSYPTPERAVRALSRAVRYAQWRARPPGTIPDLDRVNRTAARTVVDTVLAQSPEGGELDADRCTAVLVSMGVDAPHPSRAHGVEVQLGVHDDPSFGAVVSFGVAGLATDLLGDRAYAAVPLTDIDAAALIEAPRAAPLLHGYGGAPAADTGSLADLALRLSALGDALPEIAECTITVIASPRGAHVTSARMRVAPPTARADTGPRRLRGF